MPLFERIVNFCAAHRLASHILFWLIVSVIFLNRYQMDEFNEIDKVLFRHIYYMSFTIVASYFLAYLIIPKITSAKNYYSVMLYFLGGSYIICVCSRIVVVYILEPLIRTPPFGQESIWVIMTDFPKLITHYFALAFSMCWLFAFFKLIKDQYQVHQRTLSLEKEKAQTELKVLKAQLNPHFLFNTLNNIYSLSLINSPVTSRSIAGLSEILDHVLYRCNSPFVPVSAEIILIKNYLELEKLRYDDRLQVNFSHTVDQDMPIAPLILLSLVENAFKHGAGENMGNPVIDIELALENNQFLFKVSNSFLPEADAEKNDRIGLTNISQQLQLVYGNQQQLKVFTTDNIFVVLLTINLNTAGHTL